MRPTWETYFMDMAELVSQRSTCTRRAVGAVFVKHNRVLVTGYNGSRPGSAHCSDAGCLMIGGHCKRTVHAELNALTQAAKHGVSIVGSDLYVTTLPCLNCYNVVISAGIEKIYYREDYHGQEANEVLKSGVVRLQKLGEKICKHS